MSEIETVNDHMVSVKGDAIILLRPPITAMSKQEALRLAAWIVTLADWSVEHEEFKKVLEAVENT